MLIFILFSIFSVFGEPQISDPEELIKENLRLNEVQKELLRLLQKTYDSEFPDPDSDRFTDSDTVSTAQQPNILFFLADDYGWANIGYHNKDNKEVDTPTMNKLVKHGVELDRFYTFNQCGPSRSALLSGRNAMHVNYKNNGAMAWNPDNRVSGYGGVAPNMTMIGTKLKEAGYKTAYSGKWDVGFASVAQMPYNNGFDKYLGFLQHANSYCSTKTPFQALGAVDVCQSRFFDLWEMDKEGHRPSPLAGTAYEEEFFLKHSLDIINEHDPEDSPLFLFHSAHLLHTPLQIPDVWLKNFTFMDIRGKSDFFRRQYAAMVQYMDTQIEKLVEALKAKNMWENTLFVFMSDNGGPVYTPAAANNFPLKGGKLTDFEGGIRVNAFVSGGFLPKKARGRKVEELGYISDWYKTFCNLAGVDYKDKLAEEYDLPGVDGIDLWPMITGTGNGRDEIYISEKAIIMGKYKLLIGKHGYDVRTGTHYPNNTCGQWGTDDCAQPGPSSGYWLPCVTDPEGDENVCLESARGEESFSRFESYPKELEELGRWAIDCEENGKVGCLYNIIDDPSEYEDLGEKKEYAKLARSMRKRLSKMQKTNFNPDRGYENYQACVAGFYYGGYIGPFLDKHGDPLWDLNSDTQAAPSCDACEVKQVWAGDHQEHCVHYPDTNEGFMCTPYINGKCTEPLTEPFVVGTGAPKTARFLCGHKSKSWAEIPEDTGEFYYAETAETDLAQNKQWAAHMQSMSAPFPDVCPLLGIRQAEPPVNVRRN